MAGDGIDDIADSYVPCAEVNLTIQRGLRHFKGDFLARRHRYRVYRRQCAFKLPDIGVHLLRDVAGDFLADVKAAKMRFFLHDGDSRLVTRRVDSGYQAPVEPADESLFERGYFAGGAVGAEDDLFAIAVQRVEGVEKFLLALLAFPQKLHVINNKGIDGAEAALETGQITLFDCLNETVYEPLAA